MELRFASKRLAITVALLAASLGAWSRSQERRVFPEHVRNSFADVQIGSLGAAFVLRGDGSLEKHEAGGSRVWSVPFAQLSEPPAMHPYTFAIAPEGDALVAGVTYRTRETVIYRVSGSGPKVTEWAEYPGLTPVDLEFSPSGELYLLAFDIALFNELSADSSARTNPESRFLHQLDTEGDILRSFGRVSYPHGIRELDRMADRLNRTRLIFSPAGTPFFYHRSEPILERVELLDGRTTGKVPLPYSGLAAQVIIDSVQFVNDQEVFHSLTMTDEEGIATDGQIRVFDLVSGDVRAISSFDPQATGLSFTRMDSAHECTSIVKPPTLGRSSPWTYLSWLGSDGWREGAHRSSVGRQGVTEASLSDIIGGSHGQPPLHHLSQRLRRPRSLRGFGQRRDSGNLPRGRDHRHHPRSPVP